MTTKALLDVEEYLHTSFDGADCEYLDGEIVERNMGELPHGRAQKRILRLLEQWEDRLSIEAIPEIRIQIHPRRYRVADVAVWRRGDIGHRIPTVAPFLVVEVLSAEDRLVRMQPKIQEYFSIGVEWIWLVDPEERKAVSYSRQNPAGTLVEILRTESPAIEIPLAEVFAA